MVDDNIVTLVPKKENTDEEEHAITASDVFTLAEEGEFEKIVLVGLTTDGKVGFITNLDSVGDVLHLLEIAKDHVMS